MIAFRYFSPERDPRLFYCSETGESGVKEEFVIALDALREACGFPFQINSGFRSVLHSRECSKVKPGYHCKGVAADIRIYNGVQRRKLVKEAIKLNFNGIGVAKTFVHVDKREAAPVLWIY